MRGHNMIVNEDAGLLEPGSVRLTDIDEYARWTESFWFSGHNRPEKESIAIMGLGLAGEAGEVVEHLKKFIRDDNLAREELKKELGDSIYYWARICKQFGFEPSEVMRANVEKLISRRERGTLRGDGDNR
jgi:NTP pyrophosphatase (non-canonical NTP hydrolase)